MEPSLLTPGPEPERPISAGASDAIDAAPSPPSPATTAAAAATPASAKDYEDEGIYALPPTPTPAEPAAVVYCLCRGPDDGSMMVECGGCAKWFHTRCVGLPLRSAGPADIEAEAVAVASSPAVELTFSIPDDWRCPRCARGGGSGGVHRGQKRERRHVEGSDGAEAEEDSEAEEAAVEEEVEALLAEQGVESGVEEDEELAACFRREVRRRRALGAYWRVGRQARLGWRHHALIDPTIHPPHTIP